MYLRLKLAETLDIATTAEQVARARRTRSGTRPRGFAKVSHPPSHLHQCISTRKGQSTVPLHSLHEPSLVFLRERKSNLTAEIRVLGFRSRGYPRRRNQYSDSPSDHAILHPQRGRGEHPGAVAPSQSKSDRSSEAAKAFERGSF